MEAWAPMHHRTDLTGLTTKTFIWRVASSPSSRENLAQAASIVRRGGVIIYPTETFYGLGCDPFNASAVRRVYEVKGREFLKPLPLIADGMESVRKLVKDWPFHALVLAELFWPGPLTLILPSACPRLPSIMHGGRGKIAVRVSSHPIAGSLAALCGGLITSTSANKAGDPPFSDPGRLPEDLAQAVDGILDGGILAGERPSTIVDASVSFPQLQREGAVPWEKILTALARQGVVPEDP